MLVPAFLIAGALFANTLKVTAGAVGAVLGLLVVLVVAAYIVIDAEHLGGSALTGRPPRQREHAAALAGPVMERIGGYVRGHEIAVSVPLDLLWAPLEGFGIQANYSDTDSSIQPNGPDFPNEPLPGLSKYVSNGTVYYERFGFAARVSARHRSEFVGEVQGFGGDRTKTSFGAETVTDVQLGYTFQSGPMQDLSILLQVNNIENEPFQTLNGDGYPQSFSEYGRTYLFGVNYKF